MTTTKDNHPPKLKAAIRIVKQDRRECYERLSLFWALELHTARQIYAALIADGWVWCVGERKWINVNVNEESEEV